MRRSPFAFYLASVFLAALCVTLRRFELFFLLDSHGLQVFRPLSAVLLVAVALSAAFFVLYSLKTLPKTSVASFPELFGTKQPAALCISVVCMLLSFLAAYQFFLLWKNGAHVVILPISLLTALSGIGGVYLELAALGKNSAAPGSTLAAGVLLTLQPLSAVLFYYKTNAPEPGLLLVLYSYLGLCAAILSRYYVTGSAVRRLQPAKALMACGLAFVLCLVAMLRDQSLLSCSLFTSYALSAASYGARIYNMKC